MKKLVLLFTALALVAAACGGGEGDPAALPINDGADAGTSADTTCLVDEPDCDDTPGGEPTDLPPPGGGGDEPPPASSPISSAADLTGPVAVTGFLVVTDDVIRLCEALAESFPPQCGGASITMTSFDQVDPDELQSEGAVTWTDYEVTIFGEMVDGTLVTTPIE